MQSKIEKTILNASRSDLAEQLFTLDGLPFSLSDYPTHYKIYNADAYEILWKCGRQVGKSTSACNRQISTAVMVPNHKSLYISPSRKQTSKYSNTKIGKVIWQSDFIQKYYVTSQLSFSVFLKMFRNGAEMNFDYCIGEDADRVRGTSVWELLVDEVQDIDWVTAGPILKSCLSGAPGGGRIAYYGTAKETENTIEWLWQHSTQHEWLVKCSHCNKWNRLDVNNIILDDLTGLFCKSCRKLINVRQGQWVAMQPDKERIGFHIPQIAVARNVEDKGLFHAIHRNHPDCPGTGYPLHKFENEVMGESTDIGKRLITRKFLEEKCCNPDYKKIFKPYRGWMDGLVAAAGGIDHSGGGVSGLSRSVLCILGKQGNGKYRVVYNKIYSVCNPVHNVEEMVSSLKEWRVPLVIADAGEGALANAILQEKLGKMIVQGQYGYFRHPFKWNNVDRYIIDKTTIIDTFMGDLIKERFVFCNADQFQFEIDDIMAEYETTTEGGIGRRVWTHSPDKPDDFLHALIFAWLAIKSLQGDLYFYKTSAGDEAA